MKSYADACPIARALDVVGERWALLVVRELLFGPQRYSDLGRALPGASTNILRDRLRDLEACGIVERDRLPPPANANVYRLTPLGHGLEPVLDALGAFGARFARPDPSTLTATSVLLYLRGCLRLHAEPPAGPFRVALGDGVWTVTATTVAQIDPGSDAVAALRTDAETFNDLLARPAGLRAAVTAGAAAADGDRAALRALLAVPTTLP